MGQGYKSYIGAKKETTHATPVTVDRFFSFNTDGIKTARPRRVSRGAIAGRRTPDVKQVKTDMQEIAGPINMDLTAQSHGLWLEAAMGTNVDAGSGPYTHTMTPGGSLPSLTVQKVLKSMDDTSRAWTYGGCKVGKLTIAAAPGQVATIVPEIVGGLAETNGTAAASASYATNSLIPFVWREASVTVNGDAVKCRGLEFSIDNQLIMRPNSGRAVTDEPKAGPLKAGGKVTIELEDLTEANLYVNGTEIDIVLGLTDGTNGITITSHTILDGDTPALQSVTDVNMFDLVWAESYGASTDADALTIVYTDSTATP